MATLVMMYPARGGLVWGQMRGCYLQSEGLHPLEGSVQHTGIIARHDTINSAEHSANLLTTSYYILLITSSASWQTWQVKIC